MRSRTGTQIKGDVDRCACGLIQMGVKPVGKVALWMRHRPEWITCGSVCRETRAPNRRCDSHAGEWTPTSLLVPGPGNRNPVGRRSGLPSPAVNFLIIGPIYHGGIGIHAHLFGPRAKRTTDDPIVARVHLRWHWMMASGEYTNSDYQQRS